MGSWPQEAVLVSHSGLMVAWAPGPHRLYRRLAVGWHLWVSPPQTSGVPVTSMLWFIPMLGYGAPHRHLAKSGSSLGCREATAAWAELDRPARQVAGPHLECFRRKRRDEGRWKLCGVRIRDGIGDDQVAMKSGNGHVVAIWSTAN